MRTVAILAVLLSACGGSSAVTMTTETHTTATVDPDRSAEADDPADETAPPAASDADCARLTRGECYLSRACTLVYAQDPSDASRYECRAPRNHCEADYSQLSAYETSPASGPCEARSGCRWVAQDGCFCACRGYGHTAVADGGEAAECDCECANGDPGGCVPE